MTQALPAGGVAMTLQAVNPEPAEPNSRTKLAGAACWDVTVPSTVMGPVPSPTLSLPVASTFALLAAFTGSVMLTSCPVAASAVPPRAISRAMKARTRAGEGRRMWRIRRPSQVAPRPCNRDVTGLVGSQRPRGRVPVSEGRLLALHRRGVRRHPGPRDGEALGE